MKKAILLLMTIVLASCKSSQQLPDTLGDQKNAVSFGYQPIDPLPVDLYIGSEDKLKAFERDNVTNKKIMSTLPDETMRLAIGKIDSKGNTSFASAKIGYAGSSYIVILDYIKFDTKSLSLEVAKDSLDNIIDFRIPLKYDESNFVVPVYVGVGLRFTATIQVNEGSVDLGNLFALGLAAESKKVTGTLLIQTLGVSGKDISSLIPMPSQINTTTIQNAIMSLSSIKAKMYEDDSELNPRIVGFYNNIGGGQNTAQKLISSVMSQRLKHKIE
ncbi:hypothetical protein [Aquimarina sp. 2304DJ70-9]|uniref:hypothetical protein n=1 Tax=Aquimarina penaris TaxID=3231044 RepID=UPI003463081D